MGIIYKITNPSGRVYVGKTYNLRKRINSHKSSSNVNNKKTILRNSIIKYGWDKHILCIIETVEDSIMSEREIYWIDKLGTYYYNNSNGMNMTKGGEGQRSTWMHKIKQRELQSERFSNNGNPFFGKKHTEDARKIISEKTRERNITKGIKVPQWGADKGRLKCIKKVKCFNIYGNIVGEYESLVLASNILGLKQSTISDSLRKNSWINGKYIFKYSCNQLSDKLDIVNVSLQTIKRPIYVFIGNSIIEYESSERASLELGIPKTTINRAALYNKLNPIRKGYIFIYKDLYKF